MADDRHIISSETTIEFKSITPAFQSKVERRNCVLGHAADAARPTVPEQERTGKHCASFYAGIARQTSAGKDERHQIA